MKILFLTDNFPPEYNAPATRTYEHCSEWIKQGAQVTVITCFPNFPRGKIYDGFKNKLYQKEVVDGITVIRVWSYITSNSGFYKRTLDFISFAITSFFAGLFVKTDIIVATSPQFFTAISGFFLAFFKRKKWIMEVRDLWPESISAVNAIDSPKVIKWLEKLELFLYRSASKVVVVTDSFKVNIAQRGIDDNKIYVVKNGANLTKYQPIEKDKSIKEKIGLNGNLTIGYIGTHGLAHGLPFIIESIKNSRIDNMEFLFIGDGAEKQHIIEMSKDYELTNIKFIDPVDKNEINRYISVIDIALVPLKKSDTFKTVIPSKIFESAAMNKPILLGVDGESRQIIEKYGAGEYFEPENEQDFVEKLNRIVRKENQEKYVQGCDQLSTDFDRKKLALQLLNIIKTSIHQIN